MHTLIAFLVVLVSGLISLATLPMVVALPLMVVIGAFTILVIVELWRSYQELESARTLQTVRIRAVKRSAAANRMRGQLIGDERRVLSRSALA